MFRNYEKGLRPTPSTLIIHCSDPRFQGAFAKFIKKELELTQDKFVPIVIGGGPSTLANPAMVVEREFLFEQILFFIKHFSSIKSVVVINHQDCGFYAKIPNPGGKKDREKIDASIAALTVAKFITSGGFNNIDVTAFFASFANASKSKITLERV